MISLFSATMLYLLVCLGSLSGSMTQFQPSFRCQEDDLISILKILWYTEEFLVWTTTRCPGPVTAKQIIITWYAWAVGANTLCFVLTKQGVVHYGQTSLLWFQPSKGHCSRDLAISFNATFHSKTIWPYLFSFLNTGYPNNMKILSTGWHHVAFGTNSLTSKNGGVQQSFKTRPV